MQVKLLQPLKFIHKENLTEFYIEHRNGANVIVAGSYVQNIKQSELAQIVANNTFKAPVAPRQKTSKELKEEAKAQEEKEKADAKAKAEADAKAQEEAKANQIPDGKQELL